MPYFKIEILRSRYLTISLSFEQLGPDVCLFIQVICQDMFVNGLRGIIKTMLDTKYETTY